MTISGLYPRRVVFDAAGAIDFYVTVFGAKETERHTDGGGKIVHAEVTIGPATVAVKEEGDSDPAPTSLDVDDPDGIAAAMEAAGARVIYPVADHEYARDGRLTDPYGRQWMLMRPPA
jgi:uncharacterized glyoxalase superfamily protein PhnB